MSIVFPLSGIKKDPCKPLEIQGPFLDLTNEEEFHTNRGGGTLFKSNAPSRGEWETLTLER